MTNLHHSNDRRKFLRMDIDSDITFRYDNAPKVYGAIGRNLSSGGIAFDTKEPVQPGAILFITVKPAMVELPPLQATAEVIRSNYDGIEAVFNVAAKFVKMSHT